MSLDEVKAACKQMEWGQERKFLLDEPVSIERIHGMLAVVIMVRSTVAFTAVINGNDLFVRCYKP